MDGQSDNMQVDLSEALAQDGQLIITNEDGNGENLTRHSMNFALNSSFKVFPVGISGMITLPVTAQMYQSLVQQQMPNNDNTVCITPMQVQNFISSNSLCGSIANSNLNASTTYIMTANNRNVINLPLPSTGGGSVKTLMSSPSTVPSVYAPKSRTIIKKSCLKKRILNLAVQKPKVSTSSSQTDVRKIVNNNSSNVKNRNRKLSNQNVEKSQTSQTKAESNDASLDDPGEAMVKAESVASE